MKDKVIIREEFIRLDAFLKYQGWTATGGEAKQEIQAGQVTVNGAVCTQRGKKLRAGDQVSYRGNTLEIGRKEDSDLPS